MSGILVDIWWRSPFRVLLEDCGDHEGGRHYSRNAKCPHESRFPLWSFLSSQLYSRCQTLWCLRTMSRKHLYNIYSQKKPLNLHKTTFVKMRKEHKAANLIWCVFSTRKSSFFQLGRITESRKIPKREIGIPKTRQNIFCFKSSAAKNNRKIKIIKIAATWIRKAAKKSAKNEKINSRKNIPNISWKHNFIHACCNFQFFIHFLEWFEKMSDSVDSRPQLIRVRQVSHPFFWWQKFSILVHLLNCHEFN